MFTSHPTVLMCAPVAASSARRNRLVRTTKHRVAMAVWASRLPIFGCSFFHSGWQMQYPLSPYQDRPGRTVSRATSPRWSRLQLSASEWLLLGDSFHPGGLALLQHHADPAGHRERRERVGDQRHVDGPLAQRRDLIGP